MLKMSLQFTDLTGEEVVEDHYFHLSKADLVEMEVSHKGGLQNHFQRIVESEDGKQIIEAFKDIILTSYGMKSEDGRRFIKNAQLREEFASSEAYSTLFLQLCTDAEAAAKFVAGIIPGDLESNLDQLKLDEQETAEREAAEHYQKAQPPGHGLIDEITHGPEGRNVFEGGTPVPDPTPVEPRVLTRAELTEMDDAELRNGLAEGRYKLS